MKKIVSIALCLLLVLSLCACGGGTSSSSSSSDASQPEPSSTSSDTTSKTGPYEITYQNAKLYKNSIGTVWMQMIVEIVNTSDKNLYLSSGSCDIEDTSGNLLKSMSSVSTYPDVLQPGEKGIMYEETTFDDISEDTPITIIPRVKAEKAKVDCLRLDVSSVSLSTDSYGDLKMLGRVENNTSDDIDDMIYVVAILYNAAGEPVGQMFTILMDELPVGEKMGFEMSSLALPDSVTEDVVATYTVYAYPLQLQF